MSGRTELDTLLGVGDDLLQGRHAGTQAEAGDHEARVSEDLVGLRESLSGHSADQVLHGDQDVIEGEGAVLELRMPCFCSGRPGMKPSMVPSPR